MKILMWCKGSLPVIGRIARVFYSLKIFGQEPFNRIDLSECDIHTVELVQGYRGVLFQLQAVNIFHLWIIKAQAWPRGK